MSTRSSEKEGRGGRGNEFHSLNYVLRTTDLQISALLPIRRMPFSERNSFPRYSVALCAALLLAALPAVAKPKAAPVQTVNVMNTGSTNTFGYKITLVVKGNNYRVDMVADDGTTRSSNYGTLKQMGPHFVHFFVDLDAATPISSLPVRHGMRSTSFGTATYIIYKGQKSPDLTFASDPRSVTLKADIDDLIGRAGARNLPRRPEPPPVMASPAISPTNNGARN